MTDEFKIDHDVPVPMKQLNVGDSFFIPGKRVTHISSALYNAVRTTGFTLVARVVQEGGVTGTRVWRTK